MIGLLKGLISQPLEVYILWFFWIGAVLLILSFLIPEKSDRIILKKKLHEMRSQIRSSDYGAVISYLDKLTENKVLRPFMLDEDKPKFLEEEELIVKAGIKNGLHPNILRLFKIFLPILTFVILVALYLLVFRHSADQMVDQAVQKVSSVVPTGFLNQGAFQSNVTVESSDSNFATMIAKLWIVVLSIIASQVPNIYLKIKISNREALIQKEIPALEMYITIMLETQTSNVYEILETLSHSTDFFKPYIERCLKDYNPMGYKRAIQNMADEIRNDEFQIVCNALKQAAEVGEKDNTVNFLKQHIINLRELQSVHREEKIKMKPFYYNILLTLPLFNVLLIWLYPWLIRALNAINTDF